MTRDRAGALALLEDLSRVAAEHDETTIWQTWTYAALGLMHEVASRDPIAALLLLRDVLSVTAAKWDGESINLWRPYVWNIVNSAMGGWLAEMRDKANPGYDGATWEQWAKAALVLMYELRSFGNAARALLTEMRAIAVARDEEALWESWGAASIVRMAGMQPSNLDGARALLEDMREAAVERDDAKMWQVWASAGENLIAWLASSNVVAARALLDDMHCLAEERDDAALWESWGQASFNLIVGLASCDPAVSRALVNDMLDTAEKHPGAVGGWQTKVVGLVLQAAFTLTKDLSSRDPDAARTLCAETLGLPETMLAMMKFGD